MRFFEVDDEKQVSLNKAWIHMIPEFKALLTRDKGSKGDYRGDKKLKATAEFTYIYFFTDFSSPIRDWEDAERRKEALYYAGLTEDQIDNEVLVANEKYFQLQLAASRPLRTLKALYKGMDAMDTYFEAIDFSKVDKQGKMLNSPTDFVNNAAKLNKMYDEVRNFEKRVEEDMREASGGIRGPHSTLGDNEGSKQAWSEDEIHKGSQHVAEGVPTSSTSFASLIDITRETARKEKAREKLLVALDNPDLKAIFNKEEQDMEEDD